METELYKSRSHSACIKAAYILFSTHLTTVFKRTWLPVLVYSIVLAALIILYMPNKAWTDAGLSTPFERCRCSRPGFKRLDRNGLGKSVQRSAETV